MTSRVLLAAVCVLLAGGCGGGADGSTLVANDGPGVWADRAPVLRLTLEQTYGTDAGADDSILGSPMVLRFFGTAAGDVYVQDGQRSRLTRFRPDGSVAWVAGREGRGPGEFYAVTGITLTPDGQALVVSMFDGRLDYWSVDGEFLRTRPIDPALGIPGVLVGFAGGLMVFRDGLPRRLGARVVIAAADDWSSSLELEIDVAPGVTATARAVSVRTYGDGIASGSNASYELRFYTNEGQLVRRVTRNVPYPVRPGRSTVNNRTSMTHNFGAVGAPMALPEGFFMVHAWWEDGVTDPDAAALSRGTNASWADPENTSWRSSFDLFDRNGRFMQSVVPDGGIDLLGARAFPPRSGSPDNR